jgi:hypothetical protein
MTIEEEEERLRSLSVGHEANLDTPIDEKDPDFV